MHVCGACVCVHVCACASICVCVREKRAREREVGTEREVDVSVFQDCLFWEKVLLLMDLEFTNLGRLAEYIRRSTHICSFLWI